MKEDRRGREREERGAGGWKDMERKKILVLLTIPVAHPQPFGT